jgi:aminopeptidase N
MSPGLGFGQAPPGFVQLTGEAFMSSSQLTDIARLNPDFFHEFFAHEVSHQWWAHEIKWVADEDVWLSESFAEYSAGLYVMQRLGADRFQGKMKVWKDNARIADPHAPIAWANNVRGPNAGLWRTGLIYNKGPYVVHMLRMQVGHENFVKAMKSLMAKYKYQEITTDQLRQEFETVVGYKLDYFFDQWFRGTGIPTFDYSSSVKQTEDGKWLATVNVKQRDKDNLKIVSMPVFFHFAKDQVITRDRPILKAEESFQVKLPEKPTSITLDDFHTLLADIVAQGATGQ